MGVYEEQARFLVAKYGTATGPVGSEGWSATTSVVWTPQALMVLLGLVLLALLVFVFVRDLLRAREEEYSAASDASEHRDAYELLAARERERRAYRANTDSL
jgi:hypothetical protein